MKSVLLSIQPKWCELIVSGKKNIEIRKTRPKIKTPFKCYIYETKGKTDAPFIDEDGHIDFHGRGQIIGEFICDEIISIKPFCFENVEEFEKQTCLNSAEVVKYLNGFYGYAWHISNLKIYDKLKELTEFYTLDNKAVQKCENRIQTYYSFTDTGYIKNGMYCDYREDWCIKCKRKLLKRPPQSWCYVEELEG